jgi:hypothetical protein
MCYQQDIGKQFEFLQREWANNPNRPESQAGIDPVIGQEVHGAESHLHKWPAQWGALRARHISFDFRGFVTLKGGEYFFAPSIRFLRSLG